MFSGLMMNTWITASVVAVIAGVVGFFAVLRGSTVTGIPLDEAVGQTKTVTPDWLDLLHTFDA